jgi:hypothetical protein
MWKQVEGETGSPAEVAPHVVVDRNRKTRHDSLTPKRGLKRAFDGLQGSPPSPAETLIREPSGEDGIAMLWCAGLKFRTDLRGHIHLMNHKNFQDL